MEKEEFEKFKSELIQIIFEQEKNQEKNMEEIIKKIKDNQNNNSTALDLHEIKKKLDVVISDHVNDLKVSRDVYKIKVDEMKYLLNKYKFYSNFRAFITFLTLVLLGGNAYILYLILQKMGRI